MRAKCPALRGTVKMREWPVEISASILCPGWSLCANRALDNTSNSIAFMIGTVYYVHPPVAGVGSNGPSSAGFSTTSDQSVVTVASLWQLSCETKGRSRVSGSSQRLAAFLGVREDPTHR